MRIRMAYGSDGLDVEVPTERTTVIEPIYRAGAADPSGLLRAALERPVAGPPLRDLVRPGQTVAISICDGTRPQPRHLVVPALLEQLDGIARLEDVVLLVATGTHRGNTEAELRTMLGDEVFDAVRVVNHDSRDASSLRFVGVHGRDVPVWLNREWLDADVRITTGFVEPHFFAGFSGGPKLVAPGLAGLDTVLVLHDAQRIGHPDATWGVIEGNPVHDDIRAVVAGAGRVDFAFDVVLNREQDIVEAYGGELFAMHAAARSAVRRLAMRPVPRLFDVVVTSNAGFPLDQNLYQSVKGMSAAATVVKPGGVIVCAVECRDGFPDHGSYRQVLSSASSPSELLRTITGRAKATPDQWQVQVQAKIQCKAQVFVHSSFLSDDDLVAAHFQPTHDVSRTVADALHAAGSNAAVCVLPEGPQTIPYLRDADEPLAGH
jgi:nickel-dependent lactate racemase